MRTLILLIFLGLLPASGQRSFESAVASAEKDLDQSLKRLATQQAAIAKDKVPLAAELRGVETERARPSGGALAR